MLRLTWNFYRTSSFHHCKPAWKKIMTASLTSAPKYYSNQCIDILPKMNKKSLVVILYLSWPFLPTKWYPIEMKFFAHPLGYEMIVWECFSDNVVISTCHWHCSFNRGQKRDRRKKAKWPHFWTPQGQNFFIKSFSLITLVSLVLTMQVSSFLEN